MSETEGWEYMTKTINGREYALSCRWYLSKTNKWRARTGGWSSQDFTTRKEACMAAHQHSHQHARDTK